jgi:ABC-type amino acid transport substrate-binding protein
MTRRTWWLLCGLGIVVVLAVVLWLAWPDGNSPLGVLFRRDQTWQSMQARGTWRVGVDPSFPPFEQLDGAGTPIGYDIDLAQRLAAEWGLKVEVVAIGFDSLVDALRAAKIDSIVSAYPYDPRLTRDVAFSTPYFDAGLRLVVRNGSTISNVMELAGKQVAVEWGSAGDMAGRQLQRKGVALTLVPFETPQEAVQALLTDPAVNALLVDNVTLRQAQGQGITIEGVGAPVESNPYVVVAPSRATDLQRQIDTTLAKFRQDGTLAGLEQKWFAQE